MAVYKRGDTWWYSFIFAGKRIQESAHTKLKTIAREAEKNRRAELERTLAGIPVGPRQNRIRTVADMVKQYLDAYSSGASAEFRTIRAMASRECYTPDRQRAAT